VIEDFDVGVESDYGADDRKIVEIGGWSVGAFRAAGNRSTRTATRSQVFRSRHGL
jgi:hypothetical protein